VVCAGVAALFAIFARDTNSFLVLVLVAALGAQALFLCRKRFGARGRASARVVGMLAGLLFVLCVAGQANLRAAHRYQVPLLNLLFQRVLPNQRVLGYFERRLDMPVTPELMRMKRAWFRSNDWYAYKEPKLAPFRQWLLSDGYSAYQHYLLAHPLASARAVQKALPTMVGNEFLRHLHSFKNAVIDGLDAAIVRGIARAPGASLLVTLVAGALWLVRGRSGRRRLLGGACLFAAVACVSQAFVTYHGDAMEVSRHAVPAQTLLELGVLLVLVGLIDTIAVWARPRLRA
jgi:hypothetical protein